MSKLTAREKKLIKIVWDFCRKSVPETLLPEWGESPAVIYTPKNVFGICAERLGKANTRTSEKVLDEVLEEAKANACTANKASNEPVVLLSALKEIIDAKRGKV